MSDRVSPRRCLACGSEVGESEACPACGWLCEAVPEVVIPLIDRFVADEETRPDPAASAPPAPMTHRDLWLEVLAVLAVGVVPNLINAALSLGRVESAPLSYWLRSLDIIGMSGCTIFATLYLIHRSGEPFARFGIARPRVTDLFLGVLLLMATHILGMFVVDLLSSWWIPGGTAVRPEGSLDYVLMVLLYAVAGFSEELVTRAYLISRLETLLRSRTKAVLFAAVAFSSYHAYQGPLGVAFTLLFGILYGVAYLSLRRIWPLALGHMLSNIWLDLLG